MITEDYVSYEVAKLLKEKGFKGECLGVYFPNGRFDTFDTAFDYNLNDGNLSHAINAPTLQMAMKWLREVKNILISVNPTLDKDGFVCVMYYIWDIDDIETKAITSGLYSHESYNECVEVAIKYCLENLI